MALEQRVPYQIGYRLTRKFGPVQRSTKDGLPGPRGPDVPAHADRFMDDVRHPGLQAYAGEDALRRGITHLDRGDDKIGLVLVFGDIHPGPVGNGWRRRAFDNMGFHFNEA